MRRDGSKIAKLDPNAPSKSAEECAAPQNSEGWRWIDRVFNNERAISQNVAGPDKVENRRPR